MALDIGLESTAGTGDPLDRELVVSLEEGELAFLFSAIEKMRLQTGVVIDAYEDARLQGEQLTLFARLLKEKILEAEQNSDQCDQFTGLQVHPTRKEIYVTLLKVELLKKLTDLLTLTQRAYGQDRALFFFGD